MFWSMLHQRYNKRGIIGDGTKRKVLVLFAPLYFVPILSLDLNVKRVNHLFRSEGWYDRRFRDWMIDTTAESHMNILHPTIR